MIFVINDLPLNNLGKNIIYLGKKQHLIIQKKIKGSIPKTVMENKGGSPYTVV